MEHDVQTIIKDFKSTKKLRYTSDYPTIMKPDRLMYVMKVFYLDSNQNSPYLLTYLVHGAESLLKS